MVQASNVNVGFHWVVPDILTSISISYWSFILDRLASKQSRLHWLLLRQSLLHFNFFSFRLCMLHIFRIIIICFRHDIVHRVWLLTFTFYSHPIFIKLLLRYTLLLHFSSFQSCLTEASAQVTAQVTSKPSHWSSQCCKVSVTQFLGEHGKSFKSFSLNQNWWQTPYIKTTSYCAQKHRSDFSMASQRRW